MYVKLPAGRGALLAVLLLLVTLTMRRASPTIVISPSTISNTYIGPITIQITGVANVRRGKTKLSHSSA